MEKRRIKEIADDLKSKKKSKNKGKGIALEDFPDDFERAYVSGHDSLSEGEEEKYIPMVYHLILKNNSNKTRAYLS